MDRSRGRGRGKGAPGRDRGDAYHRPGRPRRREAAAPCLASGVRAVRNDRGFALLAVMLVLALLGVVVTEFAVSMRLEASMVRSYRDGVVATHLAEAAV